MVNSDSEGRPKHVAVTLCSSQDYEHAAAKGISLAELYAKRDRIVLGLIELQAGTGIPVITVYLLPEVTAADEEFEANSDALEALFAAVKSSSLVHDNQVKVSVLGKWYDLPGRVVESIKSLIEETKDYDRLFLNFCVNYNGQEEIADACRVIAMKVKSEKLEPEGVTRETIKENIYTSYFIPPDIIIKNGEKQLDGFLLWDSAYSKVFFTGKHWSEFSKRDFERAVG